MTFAYWCIFAVIFFPIALAMYAKHLGNFSYKDNHEPRQFFEHTTGLVARANAAQLNSYEIFPPFAVAVVIAHQLHAEQNTIDALSIAFVISRLAFYYCYLTDKATMRSVAFSIGLVCISGLFFVAL